ncbi:peptide deformylase [Streptomyces albus]|uniref:Peptide deformylase n=1 Tax=Streptomyces albus TaxID=1888 RepID=A0A8H1QKE1_9ACTN|nr:MULTISPECIES: peptide deformylase [Streptomyces]KPC65797.1 peptide deformylase [Streptomyces sp. NRRL F-6602]MDI6412192.1 peptide deformylase [Streptomyces albus]TGG76299.1 peptide deformylase [Streptomyces albus]UVN58179.1 peptide deformylase [Streptomyces albus]
MRRGRIPGSAGAVRPVRTYGDPVLHAPSRPVGDGDRPTADLVEDLFASMYAAHGVGLAACQIGVPLRMFVYDCPDDEDRRHRGHIVNPRLVHTEGVTVRGPEGCLSLPGLEAPTPRADVAVVEGEDVHGNPLRVEGTGFFARCLQHECDHLEGRLYTDRLGGLARWRTLRAVRRASWSQEPPAPARRPADA